MRLAFAGSVAALSLMAVPTGASAQDVYVTNSPFVAPPTTIYMEPAPLPPLAGAPRYILAEPQYVVVAPPPAYAPAPSYGYVTRPKPTYRTISTWPPRRSDTDPDDHRYITYGAPGACTVDVNGYRYCN